MTKILPDARPASLVAEICMYGIRDTGAGFIARNLKTGAMVGNGEPTANRSFTAALWLAVETLKTLGLTEGCAVVFAPSAVSMAVVDLTRVPAYGDLAWVAAPMEPL